jgi:hypothetical protein
VTPVARGLRRSPHRCHSGALTLYPSGHLVEIASALRKSLVASLSVIGQTSTSSTPDEDPNLPESGRCHGTRAPGDFAGRCPVGAS